MDKKQHYLLSESSSSLLGEIKEFIRLTSELSQEVVWVWNLDSGLIWFSEKFDTLFGYDTQEKLFNRAWWNAKIFAGDQKRLSAEIKDVIKSNSSNWNTQYKFLQANGEYISIISKAHVIRDAKGTPQDIYGFIQPVEKTDKDQDALNMLQLSNLTHHLQLSLESERKQISRILQDSLFNDIGKLQMDLYFLNSALKDDQSEARKITMGMIENTDNIMAKISAVASKLTPSVIEDLGLISALDWLLSRFSGRTGCGYKTELCVDTDHLELESSVEIAVFRIFEEAISNIERHAKSSHVCLKVTSDSLGGVTFILHDNGVGISGSILRSNRSLGIANMKQYASSFGGALQIDNSNAGGARLILEVPVIAHANAKPSFTAQAEQCSIN